MHLEEYVDELFAHALKSKCSVTQEMLVYQPYYIDVVALRKKIFALTDVSDVNPKLSLFPSNLTIGFQSIKRYNSIVDSVQTNHEQDFFAVLDAQLFKVERCYRMTESHLLQHLQEIEQSMDLTQTYPALPTLKMLWVQLQALNKFSKDSYSAICQLLRHHDRRAGWEASHIYLLAVQALHFSQSMVPNVWIHKLETYYCEGCLRQHYIGSAEDAEAAHEELSRMTNMQLPSQQKAKARGGSDPSDTHSKNLTPQFVYPGQTRKGLGKMRERSGIDHKKIRRRRRQVWKPPPLKYASDWLIRVEMSSRFSLLPWLLLRREGQGGLVYAASESPARVTKHVMLGDRHDAHDKGNLRRLGVTHILNCTHEVPNYFEAAKPLPALSADVGEGASVALTMRDVQRAEGSREYRGRLAQWVNSRDFAYERVPLPDAEPHPGDDELYRWLLRACTFIEHVQLVGGRVLVHCSRGLCRGPSVVMAYMISKKGLYLTQALRLLQSMNPDINVTIGARAQLARFEMQETGGQSSVLATSEEYFKHDEILSGVQGADPIRADYYIPAGSCMCSVM